MSDFNPIPNAGPAQPLSCEQCETLLADRLDGTLTGADQASFDRHIRECEVCSAMMADAQRGAAWLEMLRSPRPEPSAELLDRILAQTSGQASASVEMPRPIPVVSPSAVPVYGSNVLPFRSRVASTWRYVGIAHILREPRLAMTAAMAFFSVALTLSMTGVRLTDMSQLRPSNLERAFFSANAAVVRYYDNLTVVAELQSRVRGLQSDSDVEATPQSPAAPTSQPNAAPAEPKSDQQPAQKPNPGAGTSQREVPNADSTETRSKLSRPALSSPAKAEPVGTILLTELLPSELHPAEQAPASNTFPSNTTKDQA